MEKNIIDIQIHIPFCRTRCAFCTLPVHTGMEKLLPAYLAALKKEILAAADELSDYKIRSVAITGGDPMLAGADALTDFLTDIRHAVPNLAEAFWSIGLLPDELSAATLTFLRNMHFSAIDLGVMTCRMNEFPLLKRPYYLAAFDGALSMATMYRQEGIGITLLAGIPGQTRETFYQTVRHVMKIHPQWLQVHSYSRFSLWPEPSRGGLTPAKPSPEAGSLSSDESFSEPVSLAYITQLLSGCGFLPYADGLCFCRPGHERPDLLAVYEGTDQMGFGSGARTVFDGISYHNTTNLYLYLEHSDQPDVIACP